MLLQRTHTVALGYYILSICAGMDLIVLFRGVPPNVDSTITGVILGVWHSALGIVAAFYYGSNSESSRKTELLAASAPAQEPNIGQAADLNAKRTDS